MPAEPTRPEDWPHGEPGQYRFAVVVWTDGEQRAAVTVRVTTVLPLSSSVTPSRLH